MKEDTSKPDPANDRREIKSKDIPNAHAVGDGAMGRNDEKVQEEQTGGEEKPSKKNERTAY